MPSDEHPTDDELRVFAAGMPVDEMIEQHIDSCERCARLIESVPGPDTFLEELRNADQRPEHIDWPRVSNKGTSQDASQRAPKSVLTSLRPHLSTEPRVALRDAPMEGNEIVRLESSEIPQVDNESRYQLLGEIGRGGMGVIVKGRDKDLGRDLAVKVLLETHKDNPDVTQRFVEEAQIGGQLQHPGVTPVYELGQFGDQRLFFTMKLIKGDTLAAILADRNTPDSDHPRILGVFEQVCQTMAYAHSKRVIHRDLKPSNVMVGAFGEVQVMDWGLAKVLGTGGVADERRSIQRHQDKTVIQTGRSDVPGESDTQIGSVMGTPTYMPPEQALGEVDRIDERSDVFGLGAILCEILTGKPPYVDADSKEVVRMARRADLSECFTRLDSANLDHELVALTRKALSAEPDARFRNAAELSAEITRHLEGVQLRVKQAEIDRARAETRRRHMLAISLVLLAFAGSIGMAAFRFQKQAQKATVMRLSAQSQIVRSRWPTKGLLLAIQSAEMSQKYFGEVLPSAHEALLNAAPSVAGHSLHGHRDPISQMACNDEYLITGDTKTVRLWDLTANQPTSSSLVLGDDGEVVRCIALSDDGRWLVTGGSKLRRWDMSTPNHPQSTLLFEPADSAVSALDITPHGRWLVSHCEDGSTQIWDLYQALPKPRALQLGLDDVIQVAISPNGRFLAARNYYPKYEGVLLDLSNTAPKSIPLPQDERDRRNLAAMTFSRDNKWLVAGYSGGVARVWDLGADNPTATSKVINATRSWVRTPVVTFDSQQLFIPNWEKAEIRGWHLSKLDESRPAHILKATTETEGEVSLEVTQDDSMMVSGCADGTVRVWDIGSADVLHEFRGHDGPARILAITPSKRWLATSSDDGTARLWDLGYSEPERTPLVLGHAEDHNASVLAISPDSRWIATTTDLHTIKLWDLKAPGSAVRVLSGDKSRNMVALEISADSRWLVCSSPDGAAQIWKLESLTPQPVTLPGSETTGPVDAGTLAISTDGRWIATGGNDGAVRLWKMNGGVPANSPIELSRHEGYVSSMAISPDGRWLVTSARSDMATQIWDLTSSDIARSIRKLKHEEAPWSIAMDRDGKSLAISTNRKVFVYSLASPIRFEPLREIEVPGPKGIWRIALGPNGRWLLTACFGKVASADAYLWDLTEAKPEPRELLGHSGIHCVAMSNDGHWVAAGTRSDGAVFLWDLTTKTPESSVRILTGHDGPTWSLRISADSRWLVTDSSDGTLRRWDLNVESLLRRSKQAAGRRLSAKEKREFQIPGSVAE